MSDFYYLKHRLTGYLYRQPGTEGKDFPDGMPIIATESYAHFLAYFMNDANVEVVSWPHAEEKPRVPYVSQWGEGADIRKGDCGPACVTMLVHQYTARRPTVDQVADACGQPTTGDGSLYTGHGQLIKGAQYYGISLETRSPFTESTGKPRMSIDLLKSQLDKGKPSIALIHYGVLRDETDKVGGIVKNQDRNFIRGHWVVVADYDNLYVYINDPNFWKERVLDGRYRTVPIDIFTKALVAVAPGNSRGEQGLIVL